jgi:uncharacterized membrane-anchored protein
MRTKLVIAAILVQFLVLGWMAGEREWILRSAPCVWLRTAPVDPRDLFRGDYVTLGYEISTIPAEKFGPRLKTHMTALAKHYADHQYYEHNRELVICAALDVHPESGVAEIAAADLTPPPSGLFIKGRVRPYMTNNQTSLMAVAYGIDAFYVQQGKGRELERRTPEGAPAGVQVPMEMQIALGRNGTAVLKDHRWNPLGIGVQIQNQDPPGSAPTVDPATGRKITRKIIRVTFYNAGSAPLAVVLPTDLRTLHLHKSDGQNSPGVDISVPPPNLTPLTDADVRLLQPGASTTADIDPARAEWLVKTTPDAPPHQLGHQDNNYQSYRIVYEPPAAAACSGLLETGHITPGPLAGRQFWGYELKPE